MASASLVDELIGSLTALQGVNAGEFIQVAGRWIAVFFECYVGNRAPLGSVRNANLPAVAGISAHIGVVYALAFNAPINTTSFGTLCAELIMVRNNYAIPLVHAGYV